MGLRPDVCNTDNREQKPGYEAIAGLHAGLNAL